MQTCLWHIISTRIVHLELNGKDFHYQAAALKLENTTGSGNCSWKGGTHATIGLLNNGNMSSGVINHA